ncbi:MAG TPA: hypothetical protein VH120_06375, partial [Gemmataceae bacterium]|nr:hypothetical protein [Gemmataceae bacterium]
MFQHRPISAVIDRPTRRRRFWLLLIGLPMLIAAASVGAWLYRANSALQAAIAEADRLDPRWRFDDLVADRAAEPPTGQNAAEKVALIKQLIPAVWPGAEMVPLFENLPPEHQLNAEQIAAVADRLKLVGPALVEARSLVQMPHGRYTIVYTPDWLGTNFGPVYACRDAVNLLRFDVFQKAHDGDGDGAIRCCHAVLNAGASIGDEPNVLPQITRASVQGTAIPLLERTLAETEPSETVLAAIQARLETVEPEPLFLYGMRGERAIVNRMFENMRNGTVPANYLGPGPANRPTVDDDILPRLPGYLAVQEAWHVRFTTEVIEIAKLPPERWSELVAAQEKRADDEIKAGDAPRMAGSLIVSAQR